MLYLPALFPWYFLTPKSRKEITIFRKKESRQESGNEQKMTNHKFEIKDHYQKKIEILEKVREVFWLSLNLAHTFCVVN